MFITLGVEDILSETVARRLVSQYVIGAQIIRTIGLRGKDHLKSKLQALNQIATYYGPVLVLTDLDRPDSCPAELVENWTGGLNSASNLLLLRVAVLEVEAWIMADRVGLANWLDASTSRIPARPEELPDPKRELTDIARQSRNRSLRSGLVREFSDGFYKPGPKYNVELGNFVKDRWDPEAARLNSSSLDRSIGRISDMKLPCK